MGQTSRAGTAQLDQAQLQIWMSLDRSASKLKAGRLKKTLKMSLDCSASRVKASRLKKTLMMNLDRLASRLKKTLNSEEAGSM